MSDELVNQVAQRVLAELRREGAAAAPTVIAGPGKSPLAISPEKPSPDRVWLTADVVAERARGGSSMVIGMNEYLTPGARDYADQKGIDVRRGDSPTKVERAVRPAPAGEPIHPAVLTRTLGLVVVRHDRKVEAVLAGIGRMGIAAAGFAASNCPISNTRAMCQEIQAGRLAGGLIIDRHAAAAMILAAKIKGIRPVQGVSPAAVAAGLRQFDANVLVVGYEIVSVYEFRAMLDGFAAGRRVGRDRTRLLEAIEELETKVPECASPGSSAR